jgi:hypothetical protein
MMAAAQVTASASVKLRFFERDVTAVAPPAGFLATKGSVNQVDAPASVARSVRETLRRVAAHPFVFPRLLAVDRLLQNALQSTGQEGWLERYRILRRRLR